MASAIFFLLLCIPSLANAQDLSIPSLQKRGGIPSSGFYNVTAGGGSMLTVVSGTFPAGLGEPINVILSANSDKDVLVDQTDNGGLRNYFTSFGFSSECLGQHSGSDQGADLGDGNGVKNETAVIRWDYGDPALGTCQETVQGGNHFRYWVQNGPKADSEAIFMALSYELPIAQQHDIIANGYNLARDWLVGNATAQSSILPTSQLTNTSTYSGSTSWNGYSYQTSVTYVSGLLPNTSDGINHYITVGANGISAVDGLVAIMDVKITGRPAPKSAASSLTPRIWQLPLFLTLLGLLL